jgi:hypothetical protein
MNPILVFTATGEARLAKQGEWIKNNNAFVKVILDTTSPFPVYTLTEIERPEASDSFEYYFHKGQFESPLSGGLIPLPRPKVKKWKFEFMLQKIKCTTDYLTQDEVDNFIFKHSLKKIEETEIEE